jgi:hypothetical protein
MYETLERNKVNQPAQYSVALLEINGTTFTACKIASYWHVARQYRRLNGKIYDNWGNGNVLIPTGANSWDEEYHEILFERGSSLTVFVKPGEVSLNFTLIEPATAP